MKRLLLISGQEYEGFMLKAASVRVPHTAAALTERQPPRDQTFRNILLSSSEAKSLTLSGVHRAWSQYWGSVTFWCGSGSPDPYLWLKWIRIQLRIRLCSSVTLRMPKNCVFSYFFLITYQQAHSFQSYLLKFFLKILFCKHPLNIGSRSGRPKNKRIRFRIPNTAWSGGNSCFTWGLLLCVKKSIVEHSNILGSKIFFRFLFWLGSLTNFLC